jgi:hypothetical protein
MYMVDLSYNVHILYTASTAATIGTMSSTTLPCLTDPIDPLSY